MINAVSVLDNTKISDFKRCPRYFLFRHVLGWKPDAPAQDLAFGIAFHVGLEHMYDQWRKRGRGFEGQDVVDAFQLALQAYRSEGFSEETDDSYRKSPAKLLDALLGYAERYSTEDFEVLYTEVSGYIPLDEAHRFLIHFRQDTVCKDPQRGLFILEHKTTSWRWDLWEASFAHSTQLGTAQHVLHCLAVDSPVYGVFVNGVNFSGKEPDFNRAFFRRTPREMEDWRQTTIRWMHAIQQETSLLNGEAEVLSAFPRNDKGCLAYNRKCPYFDCCPILTNPLRSGCPVGFEIEFWDPRTHEVQKEGHLVMGDTDDANL